jgi:hypothetical protein
MDILNYDIEHEKFKEFLIMYTGDVNNNLLCLHHHRAPKKITSLTSVCCVCDGHDGLCVHVCTRSCTHAALLYILLLCWCGIISY